MPDSRQPILTPQSRLCRRRSNANYRNVGFRYSLGSFARALEVEQAAKILQREQMHVDAREVTLAHQILQLRGVEVLEVFLSDAVHAGDLHRPAALVLVQRGLHGELL